MLGYLQRLPGAVRGRLLPGALLPNTGLRFVCRQVELEVVRRRHAVHARVRAGQRLSIPVKHTTGRYYAPPRARWVEANGQVLLRYAPGENPNGSVRDIAGVRNERGNVFGLMPHPEHAVDPLVGPVGRRRCFSSRGGAHACR